MSWPYACTPHIWPTLAAAVIAAGVSLYSLRWRSKPAALPLALTCFFLFIWALGSVLEMAAVDASTRIFWTKFQATCKLPTATAELCDGMSAQAKPFACFLPPFNPGSNVGQVCNLPIIVPQITIRS